MLKHPLFISLSGLLCFLLVVLALDARPAQGYSPTPIVISLTPPGSPTPLPTPTDGMAPDRLEPNDDASTAAPLTWGRITDLTLIGDDVDVFTGFLKAGQWLQLDTFVTGALDTRLVLTWNGQTAAENDDRAATDLGSRILFVAPTDGWYLATVSKAAPDDGRYDLDAILTAPTETPTPLPTLTPTPTVTPNPSPTPLVPPDMAEPNETAAAAWPLLPGARQTFTLAPGDVDTFTFLAKAGQRYSCETVTPLVDTQLTLANNETTLATNDDRAPGRLDSALSWTAAAEQIVYLQVTARGGSYGAYDLVCALSIPAPVPPAPALSPTATATGLRPTTVPLTPTNTLSLTLRYLGSALPAVANAAPTHVHLLIYYDANNDRAPGPGEGVPDVSVLAVDAQGQRLARVFTNVQGEAIFNLDSASLDRVLVPFVPGWSARIRPGQANDNLVLGLPAVRLPVFLPVASQEAAR